MKIATMMAIGILGLNLQAATCFEELQSQLERDANLKIVQYLGNYACGAPSACAIVYENDQKPYSNSLVLAYLDQANKLGVSWAHIDETQANGWEKSGEYYCSDVKTYLSATFTNETTIQLNITKETARDTLFCPVQKTFISYQTQCVRQN